ncbi:MAG: ATP-binding protein [Flavobacteriaceae bacterium]|nr:ATP-binding protein [Flavobacteriaceae bacterium]|tara:strand:+ start:1056 stop:2129 length:1074 start_codon:yes stop_codon:yes gene_type:complete
MKFPFKIKSSPQAFRASLFITIIVFFLEFIFFQFISSNSNYRNETLLLSVLSFLILFVVVRITLEIFIRKYVRIAVSKILSELNPEIVKDFSDNKNLDIIADEIITNAKERRSEIDVLKDQENYRREFLGNISHELKTPLFTIQGYILTLVEGAMKDKKVREKYLKRAAKGVDRLISIVKDLDLITQFESGIKTVDKSDFNINELVDNVFELMEFESEKNNITLEYKKNNITPVIVHADQERILQVLTNLVVNSIKYGCNNGYTKVVVEDFNKEKVIIKVIDDGEGIEEEHLPRLFERFYRIDKNRSRKKGGSGLGLSIVKHIIEAHKEQIFVKSQIGKGTEFSFTLQKPKTSINFL